jgi:pimeloyl-ACP methyl ester carboxylesterase
MSFDSLEMYVNTLTISTVDPTTFYSDVAYIESLWRRTPVGQIDLPIIDIGEGAPLVFVPVLEHLEFIYARQVREFSQSNRVILYRRREVRSHAVGFAERTEELRAVLDSLGLECVDLVAHGDAAMVLLEFAIRYPQRCRSLIIIAQGADYQIAPHPFIWLLHEIFVRLPVHNFDIRARLDQLTMPILLINREDDVLAPEPKTRWFSEHVPNCAGYHVISGGERFFMYSQAEVVNQYIANFLTNPTIIYS